MELLFSERVIKSSYTNYFQIEEFFLFRCSNLSIARDLNIIYVLRGK